MKKIVILFLALFFCSTAFAAPFKQIIFFGDSLSDNGNLYHLTKIFPPSPPYFQGRFSNGPTWAEDVGKAYYDKYYTAYANYAYGGATAILHAPSSNRFIAPTTLEGELISYYLHSMIADKSKILYVIWIGANDYLFEHEQGVNEMTTKVVNKIAWSMTSLIGQGAQNFLILNLPDLGKTPYAKMKQSQAALHAVTVLHNQKLADTIVQLQNKYPTIKFVEMDVYSTFDDLVANPDKYNQKYHQSITDVSDACLKVTTAKRNLNLELQAKFAKTSGVSDYILNSPSLLQTYNISEPPCDNPNQYVFWDPLHPSAVVHQMLADTVMDTLTNAGLG